MPAIQWGILALTVTPADTRRISIDIDSLLIGSSLTSECLVEALRRHPALAFRLPFWALRGKTVLRQRLAQYAESDVAALPYRAAALSRQLRRSAEDGGTWCWSRRRSRSLARKRGGPSRNRRGPAGAGKSGVRERGSLGWIRARGAAIPMAKKCPGLCAVPLVAPGGRRARNGSPRSFCSSAFRSARRPDMS